jgi:hypothetical protein
LYTCCQSEHFFKSSVKTFVNKGAKNEMDNASLKYEKLAEMALGALHDSRNLCSDDVIKMEKKTKRGVKVGAGVTRRANALRVVPSATLADNTSLSQRLGPKSRRKGAC